MGMSNIISDKNDLVPYVLNFILFLEKKGLTLSPYPKLKFLETEEYVNDVFGKTAWYSPEDKEITVIITGRHPKDIMRSIAHELIHHDQNVKGLLKTPDIEALSDPNYAKNNKYLNKIEMDAYLRGNILFREWEDCEKNNS